MPARGSSKARKRNEWKRELQVAKVKAEKASREKQRRMKQRSHDATDDPPTIPAEVVPEGMHSGR